MRTNLWFIVPEYASVTHQPTNWPAQIGATRSRDEEAAIRFTVSAPDTGAL